MHVAVSFVNTNHHDCMSVCRNNGQGGYVEIDHSRIALHHGCQAINASRPLAFLLASDERVRVGQTIEET